MSKGTTRRAVRIDDDLWTLVQAQAAAEGINVSDLIRRLLRGWLNTDKQGEE